MPQQSHQKGRERVPENGGTGPRETGAEGREERKGGEGEERMGGTAKRSEEERGKGSDEGRAKKKTWKHTHQRRGQNRKYDILTPRIGASEAD